MEPALVKVRRALLDSDVNVKVADALLQGVLKRSQGTVEIIKDVTAEDQFIKCMYDELVRVMGGTVNEDSNTST